MQIIQTYKKDKKIPLAAKGVIRPPERIFSVNKDFFKNASGQKNAKFNFFLVKINIR